MSTEIDFSSSFCSLESSKFKKNVKKDIQCQKINIWNHLSMYLDKTILQHLALRAKN